MLFTVGSCTVTLPYTRTITAAVHGGFLGSHTPLHTHNLSFLSCTTLERLALLAVTLPTLSCLICSKSLHLQVETPGSSALTKPLWCQATPLSHSSRGLSTGSEPWGLQNFLWPTNRTSQQCELPLKSSRLTKVKGVAKVTQCQPLASARCACALWNSSTSGLDLHNVNIRAHNHEAAAVWRASHAHNADCILIYIICSYYKQNHTGSILWVLLGTLKIIVTIGLLNL